MDTGTSTADAIKKIKKVYPLAEIIVLTLYDEEEKVFNAICAGAVGYISKITPAQKIVEAMNEVLKGRANMSTGIAKLIAHTFRDDIEDVFTTKEADILRFLSRGKSYSTIADELHSGKDKIHNQIKNMYKKLNNSV